MLFIFHIHTLLAVSLLSTTNEMQRYTILFIVVSNLHVPSGVSAHHQELKSCTCNIGYLSNLFTATANVDESEFIHVSGSSKQV